MIEIEGTENTGTEPNDAAQEPVTEKPVEKAAKPKTKKAVKVQAKSTGKKAKKPAVKKVKATKPKAKAAGKKAAPRVEKSTVKQPKAVSAVTTDRQLPKIGTVIEKIDRHGAVRCKCEVTTEGIKYKSKLYGSLSAAAMAAAADLGLGSKTLNGWLFWGLIQSAPTVDPVEAVQKLSARIIERTRAAMSGTDDAVRSAVEKAVKLHVATLAKLLK